MGKGLRRLERHVQENDEEGRKGMTRVCVGNPHAPEGGMGVLQENSNRRRCPWRGGRRLQPNEAIAEEGGAK